MTTLSVTRVTEGRTYTAVIPVVKATDAEFDAHFADQLREYLYRHGHPNALTASRETLLESVRGLFALPR